MGLFLVVAGCAEQHHFASVDDPGADGAGGAEAGLGAGGADPGAAGDGSVPSCNGGPCPKVLLVGTVVTVSQPVLERAQIRLVDSGLEQPAPICDASGKRSICVIGGIQP